MCINAAVTGFTISSYNKCSGYAFGNFGYYIVGGAVADVGKLELENRLEKVNRICTEFTKMVCIICKLRAQNFPIFVAEF